MRIYCFLEMGHSKKNKSKEHILPKQPSEYDLMAALHALNQRNPHSQGVLENTSTEFRIGSVNISYVSVPDTESSTGTSSSQGYVSEQYVNSLFNNLKAEQTESQSKLRNEFNEKITKLSTSKVSRNSFWVGIGIAVSVILGFYYYKTQKIESSIDNIGESVSSLKDRVDEINRSVNTIDLSSRIDAMMDSIEIIKQHKIESNSSYKSTSREKK